MAEISDISRVKEPDGEPSLGFDSFLFEERWVVISIYRVAIKGMIGFLITSVVAAASMSAGNTYGCPLDLIWKFLIKGKIKILSLFQCCSRTMIISQLHVVY